jgi:hypothetical protein
LDQKEKVLSVLREAGKVSGDHRESLMENDWNHLKEQTKHESLELFQTSGNEPNDFWLFDQIVFLLI